LALFEEVVGAESVAKVKVLPWLPGINRASCDGIPVDEHPDRAKIAFEVAGIAVRLGQRRRRDPCVVLRAVG
jgi:hypothetical protein